MLKLATMSLLICLTSIPATLHAQIRYKDAEGVTHWVDSIEKVPPQFKDTAIGRQSSPPDDTATARPAAPAPAPAAAEPAANPEQPTKEVDRPAPEPLTTPQPAQADASPKPFDYGAFQVIVDSCITKTHSAFKQKDRTGRVIGESTFTAFVSGPGYVSLIGSTPERSAFQQCMANEGAPLVSQ